MDGFQATAEIRKWERSAEQPHHHIIIALTADVMQGMRIAKKD